MFTTRPEIVGTFDFAASTHWLAAQTAMGVLECWRRRRWRPRSPSREGSAPYSTR
jgi:hypothetical protein